MNTAAIDYSALAVWMDRKSARRIQRLACRLRAEAEAARSREGAREPAQPDPAGYGCMLGVY